MRLAADRSSTAFLMSFSNVASLRGPHCRYRHGCPGESRNLAPHENGQDENAHQADRNVAVPARSARAGGAREEELVMCDVLAFAEATVQDVRVIPANDLIRSSLAFLAKLIGSWFRQAIMESDKTDETEGASRSNEMHRRFVRDGRILNCRTGVEPDTRRLTGRIGRAEDDRIALGPSSSLDNVLLTLEKSRATISVPTMPTTAIA